MILGASFPERSLPVTFEEILAGQRLESIISRKTTQANFRWTKSRDSGLCPDPTSYPAEGRHA